MSADPIRILFTGDFCPHNRIEQMAMKGSFDNVFKDIIEEFQNNDLNVTDLECPLTTATTARPKTGPHQKAHPDGIKLLKHAGIELAATANNHIMDYGAKGFTETMEVCKINGIETIGTGKNQKEASAPYFLSAKNKRTAILNYADNEFLSTPDGMFTANPVDPVNCFNKISELRKESDFIIVIVHAGNEFYELPSPRTKNLYRFLVDSGADAVISHHTHAFSGYEVYKSKPIFYGLGNFLYDWPGKTHTNWNSGYAVRLLLSEKIDFEIIPFTQNNETPGIFRLNNEETNAFEKKMDSLNRVIIDDEKLETEFLKYCKSVFPMYDAFIEPHFGKIITALRKRGFFPKMLSRRKRLLLLNINRCESHRDVLLRMLKQYE